jgi:hypothetical protein
MIGKMRNISIVVVTSPFGSMPSTSIINYVLKSCDLVDGLQNAPVKIVFDGFKLGNEDRWKKGRITEESKSRYDQYYDNLARDMRDSPHVELIRSPEHLGFAMSVKLGLEHCTTKYALIAQHDRCFCTPFNDLHLLLDMFEKYEYIRYIGFPTSNNVTHDRVLTSGYKLTCLNYNTDIKFQLGPSLFLQPLIFWFDSQHLCHVERYLNIYKPYKTLPVHLREVVGLKAVKDMFLKPGDFIEDRFGQVQRNLFATLRENNCPDAIIVELFRWYGSYLCWITDEPFYDETQQSELCKPRTQPMVKHLHGREFNYEKLLMWMNKLGPEKIRSKRYLEIFSFFKKDEPGGGLEEEKGVGKGEGGSTSSGDEEQELYQEALMKTIENELHELELNSGKEGKNDTGFLEKKA